MQDFKKLKVWEKAHQLTLDIYKATAKFPKDALYGLTSQIRRSSASIPANIAEGCGRSGKVELARFLQISFGSASELEYHVLLAKDLNLLQKNEYQLLTDNIVEIKRMIATLIKKLNTENR
ncbi:MAG: four helix bundle protein [Bacteroidetes bacterium]|nr:four helix bundle protein [Bacteroidota bacterium]MCL5739047.1 four helix bundle protein [Bacteroidota bacterium]